MEKEILISSNNNEKKIKVEYFLLHVNHSSNIDDINSDLKNNSPKFNYEQHQTLDIKIQLKVRLDDKITPVTVDLFFKRYSDFEPVFSDEDYGIEYLNYLAFTYEKPDDITQLSFLENLLFLINTNFYNLKNHEKAFYNIDPETLLLDFQSYKQFNYGIYFQSDTSYSHVLQFQKQYSNMGILTILPINYKNYYIKKQFPVQREEVVPNSLNLILCPKGDLIFSGTYEKVYKTLNNQKELNDIMNGFFEKRRLEDNKKYKNYDIRREVDWSNFNDDLDKDQQDPDFWNQF